MQKLKLTLGLMGLLLAFVQCSASPQQETFELIEKNRTELQAKLAALEQIGQKLATLTSPVTDTPKIQLHGPTLIPKRLYNRKDPVERNAIFLDVADFQNLQDPPVNPFVQQQQGNLLKSIDIMLKATVNNIDPEQEFYQKHAIQQRIRDFVGLNYAIVLRNMRQTLPAMLDTQVYQPGSVSAEVLIFSLKDAAYLGGFPLAVQSSAQVGYRQYDFGVNKRYDTTSMNSAVATDLQVNFEKAFFAALKQKVEPVEFED